MRINHVIKTDQLRSDLQIRSTFCCVPEEHYLFNFLQIFCCHFAVSVHISFSNFNGHFPGESGLAGVYWSKGWWRWWWQLDYWSYKSCKAPVRSSPPTNQHPVSFTDRMPFLSPNQQCQNTVAVITSCPAVPCTALPFTINTANRLLGLH